MASVLPHRQVTSAGVGSPRAVDAPRVDEDRRLAALHSYDILDSAPEEAFDDLARLAAQICATPTAMVNLVDRDRLWQKAAVGSAPGECQRRSSPCDHALDVEGVLVVRDARADLRFARHPDVAVEGGIRFYAGVPLRTPDGLALGTLCVADSVTRRLSDLQLDQLAALGRQVMAQLTLRRQRIELEAELAARSEASEALSASEARWRSLAEHSHVAVTIVAEDLRFAYVNPPALRLFGATTADELVGRPSWPLVAAGDREDAGARFAGLLRGETLVGERFAARRLDGTLVEVEVNGAAVEYAGRPAVQIELRDVTAHLQAEEAIRSSALRWRALFTGSPVGIGVADEDGRLVAANDALCALLGRPVDAVLGRTLNAFTLPEDRSSRARSIELIEASGNGVARVERRYVRADGEVRWAWLTMARSSGPAGEAWMLGHFQDITERKAVEEATTRSAADLAAMAAVAERIQQGDDARQTIVDAGVQLGGAGWVSLVEPGVDEDELVVTASTDPALVGVTMPVGADSTTAEVFRTGRPALVADPSGDPRVSQTHLVLTPARSLYVRPVRSGDRVIGVLIVAWDHRVDGLEDRRMATIGLLADQAGVALRQATLVAELEALAVTDPLTALLNRRGWDRLLGEAMAESARDGAPLTVALGDVDHFKRFNDTHGHSGGDELLREFAEGLRTALRRGDTAARWGGEEFAFALPDCPAGEAPLVLARFRAAVPLAQTCSIGFATWDGREPAEALMARADRALYRAKEGGRDRIVAADPADTRR